MSTTPTVRPATGPATGPATYVPEIALNQIKALDYWAFARWGVKDVLSFNGDTLQLNCARGRRILVTLDRGTDTYRISVGRVRNFEFRELASDTGAHAEDLVIAIDTLIERA